MSETRPNILFIFADDWGRYASAYRQVEGEGTPNALLDTPHFDRIAREGVLFTNAFVPAPSCTPCRSSLLSGRYFWNTERGAILQGAVWDSTIPTYPLLLEESGYHIGYTYKVWSPGTPRDEPYGGDRTRYAPAGARFGQFSQTATSYVEERGVEGAKEVLYDEVRDNFEAFLQARPQDAPLCYWWRPTNTHRKWERGSGKDLWGLEPDDLEGRLPDFLPDVHEVREDVCDYLGECLAVDAGLGLLLKRVEELGELDNTLVVVSGDHGIPGFPRGKCNLYDLGCEVALAVRWPGRVPEGRIVEDFVNLMDLAPTFLQAGGLEPPDCMSGRGLMDVLEYGLESGASGWWTRSAPSSSPVGSATSAVRGRGTFPTRNARSARRISSTSATTRRSAGPWEIQRAWMIPTRSLRHTKTYATIPICVIGTWTQGPPRRG